MIYGISRLCAQSLISAIKAYQRIRSLFSVCTCRFYPSCSEYAIDVIKKNGTVRGSFSAIWRILRCSPLSKGGHDPVR